MCFYVFFMFFSAGFQLWFLMFIYNMVFYVFLSRPRCGDFCRGGVFQVFPKVFFGLPSGL